MGEMGATGPGPKLGELFGLRELVGGALGAGKNAAPSGELWLAGGQLIGVGSVLGGAVHMRSGASLVDGGGASSEGASGSASENIGARAPKACSS